MKMPNNGVVVACVLAWSFPCHAQAPRIQFNHLTVEDGLSDSWVQSILKDSRGFLWFGTQDGLNRYDGGGIKVYRQDPLDPHSLPSSVAMVVFEDSKKRLWIGSGWSNAGVALYDRERDRFTSFLPNPDRTGGNEVMVMLEDRQGRLWLGTDDGIAWLDPESGAVKRYPSRSDGSSMSITRIISLYEDRRGRLWIGTTTGLLRFDRKNGEYARWPGSRDEGSTLNRVQIEDIYEDEAGVLWVATLGDGLQRVDMRTGGVTRYLPDPHDPNSISHARVRRLVADGKGTLYIAFENGGINILDLRTRKFTHIRPEPEDETSLSSASIWSMHLDRQGILWIGTYNTGVDYASPMSQRFQHLRARPGGLSVQHVSAVMEDHRGDLWIGTDGGGLNRLERKTGRFTHYRHDPNNDATIGSDALWALFEDSQRNVWIGGWDGGLGLLNQATGWVTRFRHDPTDSKSLASDHVWRILELRTGELLIVTQAGADLFDRNTRSFTRLSERYPGAGEGVLFSAAEDREGNIWLVGDIFVGHIDRRTGRVTRYRNDPRDPSSLGAGWTQAVLVDSAGNVWLGTQGGLSCVFTDMKEMRRYTTADGLPHNTINSMQEDGSGNLWLGTNRGLSKLLNAVQIPAKPTFVNFDVHDGLQGYEFARNAAFRGKSGEIYFGGSRGLNLFYPERIQRNAYVPPVVLTDLKIFNKSVGIGTPGTPLDKAITESSELTLSYRHSMVTFEFAALNFLIPQKNQYAYKLEGFDKSWNEVGTQRTATYTNLSHGSYTLRVRGSNNDGVWNEQGVSLRIRVTPPLWKTSWFFACVGFALMSFAVGLHRLRVRRHVVAKRALELRVTEALAHIKTLRGLLPICAWCRKVRDDKGYWSRLEEYVSEHTNAEFSHGICPECQKKRFKRFLERQAGPHPRDSA